MKITELSGHKVQIKRGTIEAAGNEMVAADSSTIAGLTFTDGETVRGKIMIESSIVPYFQSGVTGTFLFADGPAGHTMAIAVDVDGRGLRVADPKPFARVRGQSIVPMIVVLAFTAFCVLGAVMIPLIAPLALIPAGIALKGFFAFAGVSKVVSIIKHVDRARQIPTARDEVGTPQEALAA